jgi:hypothetical protein
MCGPYRLRVATEIGMPPAMGSFSLRAREKVTLIALAVFSAGTWLLLLYYWKTVFFILVVVIFIIWP